MYIIEIRLVNILRTRTSCRFPDRSVRAGPHPLNAGMVVIPGRRRLG